MRMMLKKAAADLRSVPGRTLLVIVALAIGLWGVGGILVSYVILTRDLAANYQQTRPPHAVLTSGDFGRLDLAALRARPEIERAEFRDLSLQRIEVRPGEWIPLWLFGVSDFERAELALVRTERGARVPPPGTMLIERDGRLVSTLDIGSRPRVRVGARVREVPVSGIAFDPAQAPATQDHFIYGYADPATWSAITGEPANRRLIVRLRGVRSKRDVESAVNRLVGELRAQGIAARSAKIGKFNAHPHQWQLDTLLLLQGGIGLLAFFMGAVLVSQLMASILARQVREIGILKAIGATRRQVLAIYLAMLLALGAVAGAIAIPLAVGSGYAFSEFVSGKLNFEILTRELPHPVYLALAAASLLLPVALSWPALRRGIGVAVREAVSDYGISAGTGGTPAGARLPARLPRGLLLAVRNSLRQKKRLAVTVLAMALGVAIFNTGFNVRASLALLLDEVRTSARHDVEVVLNRPMDRQRALAPFRGLEGVARVETWNGGRGELQSQVVATAEGVGIVALPHDTDLFRPRLTAGRWLRVADPPEAVMNQKALELYRRPPVGAMQTLAVGGKPLAVRLVGVIAELDKPKIYLDRAQYDAHANPEHRVNSLMFVARDQSYAGVMALKRDIEAAILDSDLSVLYVMSQAERVKVIYDHLNIILTTVVLLSLSVLVVSALGMASATGINILERTREIGVLRAIGATPRMVFRLFVAEGMITSLAAIALGLALAWPLSGVAARFFGTLMLGEGAVLRYAFSAAGFWITLAATLAFGWLASRIPARRAVRVATRDALAYE